MVESGATYGIIDPDYGRIYSIARTIAWQEGYALCLHGSFTRDLDLIAVPWTDRARSADRLMMRVVGATGLTVGPNSPAAKPHGRTCWTLLLPTFGDPRFVDFSVMPPLAAPPRQIEEADIKKAFDEIHGAQIAVAVPHVNTAKNEKESEHG